MLIDHMHGVKDPMSLAQGRCADIYAMLKVLK